MMVGNPRAALYLRVSTDRQTSDNQRHDVDRTKAGLERARREGKRIGRPPASPILLHAARDLVAAGVPIAEAAPRKGVARSTLQRFLKARVQ